MSLARLALIGLGAGVAGWALENTLFAQDGPRYSKVLGPGNHVPFLPVYAAGGIIIGAMAPAISANPWYVRGLLYGSVLTGLEALAGSAERAAGRTSWDYDGAVVDLPHAAAWAGLGLLAEKVVG